MLAFFVVFSVTLNILAFIIFVSYLYGMVSKTDIIARLQREILPLQGYKPRLQPAVDQGLRLLSKAFPGEIFPLGAIHEFHHGSREDKVSTCGFIAGVLSAFTKNNSISVWVCRELNVFPPALSFFGLKPEHVVFVELKNARERGWAIEEALKCKGLSAVVGETEGLSFMQSRRLQLAVERSGVTGFIVHNGKLNTTSSIARWKVKAAKSIVSGDMPGIGFPAWDVELARVRNGKPRHWDLTWSDGGFMEPVKTQALPLHHRKTG